MHLQKIRKKALSASDEKRYQLGKTESTLWN